MAKTKQSRAEYHANLKDSLRAIGRDYVQTHMPAISLTITSTQSALTQFRSSLMKDRNRIGTGIRYSKNAVKTYVGETLTNMKSDIKTGKLYKIADTGDSDLGSIMEDYGGESSENYGSAESFAGSLGGSPSEILNGLRDTGSIVSGATEHLANIINANNTNASITGLKQHMEQMSVLGNIQNLAEAQVKFNLNEVTGFIQSSLDYYDESINRLTELTDLIRDMKESSDRRYGGQSSQKSRVNDLDSVFGTDGFNLGSYINTVKKNAKDSSGMLGLVLDSAKASAGNFKDNPIGMLMKLGLSLGTSKATKGAFGNLNNAVNGGFASYLLGMNKMKKSGNPLLSFLGNMLGVDLTTGLKVNTSSYKNEELTKEVENKKIKAITEVIPQYLSEITRSISGIDKVYDYDRGVFIDRKKRDKTVKSDERSSAVSAMSDSRQAMSNNLYKIEGGMGKEEKEIYQEDLDSYMYFLATVGENINPESLKYATAVKRGLILKGGEQSFTMLTALYKSLSKAQKTRLRGEQLSAITAIRSMREMGDRALNFSGGIGAYNQFYSGVNVGPMSKAASAAGGTPGNAPKFSSQKFSGKNIDDIISEIESSNVDPIKRDKADMTSDEELAAEAKKKAEENKVYSWFKKKFDIKNHKLLNSLFGDNGFFPGVISNTADMISSIVYGDGTDKEKGIFGEMFTQLKTEVKKITSDIGVWIKGKLGESKLWKKIFGDPKGKTDKEKGGWMGSLKDDLVTPAKDWMKKNLFSKISGFYDKYLKARLDKLHTKADSYRKDFFSGDPDDVIGSNSEYANRKSAKAEPEKKQEQPIQDVTESILNNFTIPEIQKVQVVAGQNGMPVWVTFNGSSGSPSLVPGFDPDTARQKFTKAVQQAGVQNDVKGIVSQGLGELGKQLMGNAPIPGAKRGGRLKGGATVVGEKGPEIAMLPAGTDIKPNNQSITVSLDNNSQDFLAQMGAFIVTGGSTKGQKKQSFLSKAYGKAKGYIKSKTSDKGASTEEKASSKTGSQVGGLFESIKKKITSSVGGNAAAGAAVSSVLGLGPMPGLIVGALIGKHKKKKLDKAEGKSAENDGKTVDDAQKKSKWQQLKSKFKGAAIGGTISTLLGLGPLPGIIVGSLISAKKNKNSKTDEKNAEKQGKTVDNEQKKQGGIKGFLKKFKGAAIGGVASTMLGLGPLPGIIIGSLIASKKKKKDIKDAEKQGSEVDKEQKKNSKGGLLKRLFGKFKGAATGAVVSTLLGLGPLPGIIVGSLLASRKKKKDIKEAEKEGEQVDQAQKEEASETKEKKKGKLSKIFGNIKSKASGIIGKIKDKFAPKSSPGQLLLGAPQAGGSQSALPAPNVAGLLSAPQSANDEAKAKNDQKDEEAKTRKAKSNAKRTQSQTKKLLKSAKKGDSPAIMKNVEQSMTTADTGDELSSSETSTSIMANAASLANNSPDITVDGGGAAATTNGLLGGIMALLGGASLGSVIKGLGTKLIGGKLKTVAKKFLKNNIGDAFAVGQVVKGGSLIKSGIGKMTAEGADNVDNAEGMGEVTRGTVSTAAGGFKLAGTIAKAATTTAKQPSILGKLTQWIVKLVKGIGAKAAGKAGKAGAATITKSAGSIAGKVIGKAGAKLVGKAASFLAKYGQPIGWAITIAQAVWDFGTGFADVRNIMETSSDYDAPVSLKIVCGLAKALSNFLLGLIPVKWLASLIYGLIGKKEDQAELKSSQEKQSQGYKDFIKAHPEAVDKGLTEEKYNQIQNKSTGTKIWEGIKGIFGGKKSSLDDYTESTTNNVVIVNDEGGGRGYILGRGTDKQKNDSIMEKVSEILANSTSKKRRSRRSSSGRGSEDLGTTQSSVAITANTGMSQQYGTTSVPYYSQIDPQWKDHKFGKYNGFDDTIGAGGCGPTTAAMMFQGLTGTKMTPQELADLAVTNGYKANGTNSKFFKFLGDRYGIPVEDQKDFSGDAADKLSHNIPVALVGKNKEGKPPFGDSNHYVLATGAKNGSISIYDPIDANNNKKYALADIQEDVKTSIVPQVDTGTSGSGRRHSTKIPTEFARGALLEKKGIMSKARVEEARGNIESIVARGADGTTTLSKVATEMLDVLKTISDNVIAIGKTVVDSSKLNTVNSSSSGANNSGTSYSANKDSATKSSKYAKVVSV